MAGECSPSSVHGRHLMLIINPAQALLRRWCRHTLHSRGIGITFQQGYGREALS